MKIPPVRGMRDFYPQQMAVRNFIIDGWKAASRRSGFEEFDGPILEYLQMYRVKSGDEIVGQLFHLTDRGDRELAIRPEITPTLARMVNQQINSLPKPIKWFSVPRLCRAERPQKGRLREFFQWNIDIIGVYDRLADAEVIFCAVDYLSQAGLTSDDVVVRISSRSLITALLEHFGVEEQGLEKVYAVLDKKSKVPAETFEKMLEDVIADPAKRQKVLELMAVRSIGQLKDIAGPDGNVQREIQNLELLFFHLDNLGISEFCRFDISIVRGLAYYTGIVFEIHDKSEQLRAICGGGRYDNLLRDFGGHRVPATGMGMGDCVLEIVLEEKGLLKVPARKTDYFVAYAEHVSGSEEERITAKLRKKGYNAGFSYNFKASLSKKLKAASECNAQKCIIIGQEFISRRELIIKDMDTGNQQLITEDAFFSRL